MKLSKIGALCKANKRFTVYNVGRGAQWLSDGYACYPLGDLPELCEEEIAVIFDVPEDKRDKFSFEVNVGLPKGLDISDGAEGERELTAIPIGIVWCGEVLLPYKSESGVLFVNRKHLAPFEEVMTLYERRTKSGAPYIAAKRGMIVEGIITPFGAATQELADLICEVGREMIVTAGAAREEPSQMSFDDEDEEE